MTLKFKALKHKKLDGVFGKILPWGEDSEVFQTGTPDLMLPATTMGMLKLMYKTSVVIEHIKDYDLINVEVNYES